MSKRDIACLRNVANQFVEQEGSYHLEESGKIDLWMKREIAMLMILEKSICGTKGDLPF